MNHRGENSLSVIFSSLFLLSCSFLSCLANRCVNRLEKTAAVEQRVEDDEGCRQTEKEMFRCGLREEKQEQNEEVGMEVVRT